MKKKEIKIKRNLINWFITLAFGGLIGLFCFAQNEIKQVNAEEVSYEISQPFKVNYDEGLSRIELSVNEVNNYTWNNLCDLILDNYDTYQECNVIYNEVYFSPIITEDSLQWLNYNVTPNQAISLETEDYKFSYTEGQFEYSLIIEDSSNYQALKNAINLDVQANQSTPSGGIGSALTDFISLIVNGISDLATGIANGVSGMAKQLFLEVDVSTGAVTGLSTFGGIIAIFAGLALAVGITTRVYTWVTSLGN